VAVIERNLAAIGVEAEVVSANARTFLERARIGARQYDLVFLDPPYRQANELAPELSAALPPVLAPGARVVCESDRRAPLALALTLAVERRYGDTLIRIYDS
jgi:16S rRNA (guanine966-N2)-methyltransferase